MKNRILIIHKDPILCAEIHTALSEVSMLIDVTSSSSEAIKLFLNYDYSLILFDIDMDGKEIVKPLRAITPVPILALCSQDDPKERCALLEAGVSACLTKPIDVQECTAQVKALLDLYFATNKRRAFRTIAYGTEFVIDPEYRTVFLKGESIRLPRKEFDLLLYLARNRLKVFSKQQLYEQVWGYIPVSSADNAVKICIKQLRRHLGPEGRNYIQTLRGVGYRFVDEQSIVFTEMRKSRCVN